MIVPNETMDSTNSTMFCIPQLAPIELPTQFTQYISRCVHLLREKSTLNPCSYISNYGPVKYTTIYHVGYLQTYTYATLGLNAENPHTFILHSCIHIQIAPDTSRQTHRVMFMNFHLFFFQFHCFHHLFVIFTRPESCEEREKD